MLIRLAPWIVLGLFPSVDVAGQVRLREDTPRWQAECKAAAAALDSRRSMDEVITSLRTLMTCERSAGDALSSFWRARPDARDEIRFLAAASREVRDRRIMDAAISTLRDGAAPGDLRMAALTVLAAYLDPSIAGIREYPEYEDIFARYSIVSTFHSAQKDGTIPLDDADRAAILNTLGEIAGGGAPDERISGAAAYISWVFELRRRRSGGG